jgi:hypothetical protein
MRLIPWPKESKRARWNSWIAIAAGLTFLSFQVLPKALAHGFNANRVRITRIPAGKYRVIIAYSHVEVGEYREAHVDFDSKDEAVATYQQLVQGADFFLGDIKKTIHFHTPPQKNVPY